MKLRIIAASVAVLAQIAAAPEAVAVQADEAEAPTAVEQWREDPTTIFQGEDVDLDAFKWIARPVVVFAATPSDPAFTRQLELLHERQQDLVARDVVVITDTNPEAESDLRQRLRPLGFVLVLMGKDLQIELRKPFPWDVRELRRSIDKMPLRKQELRDRRDLAN